MTSRGTPARLRHAGVALGLAAMLGTAWPAPVAAEEIGFDLAIASGRIDPSQRTLRVRKGDSVRLRVTADRPGTLHLHGYALEARVTPGAHSGLSFAATATGRFPLHWHADGEPASTHRHGAALAHIEVYPR